MALDWRKLGDRDYELVAGGFLLTVCPQSGPGPYEAWVSVVGDDDSDTLPHVTGLASAEEAKTAIVEKFGLFLKKALDALQLNEDEPGDE